VVIPCWNGEEWIEDTIQSVLDQGYHNLEIIVVYDGSTDRSLDIIKSFEGKIGWEAGANSGACRARNRGLALSKSDYVVFLDADDRLNPGFFSGARKALVVGHFDMIVAPLVVAAYGKLALHDHFFDAQSLQDWVVRFLERSTPQTGQVIWRSDFVRRIKGWNEAVLKKQDVELGLRAITHAPRIIYLRDVFAFYNWHQGDRCITLRPETARQVASQFDFFEELSPQLVELGGPRAANALAHQFYALAMAAYDRGDPALGRVAEERARALGTRRHVGTLSHRIAATILGLEWKQAVARKLRSSFRRIRGD
jgi:glycosyltransferase involved in cell wall biosynthesis